MVEFNPDDHVTIFNYAGLKVFIASLFDRPWMSSIAMR